jgi:predicted RNase H-like nuclease (RuvC/YqgF family)
MKFAGQVASYQNKLRRRSRFFSSLMLVSGVSLAAVAPFLSLEVSKIECGAKGKEGPTGNDGEVQSLMLQLDGKDEAITDLEAKVEQKDQEIRKLASNPDCDNLIRVITEERDRLDEDLTEVTTESETKDETITDLEHEVEEKTREIADLTSNPDCDNLVRVVEVDRDRLAAELREVTAASWIKDNTIERLENSLEACEEESNQPPDCEKYTAEINELQGAIATKERIITRLRERLQKTGVNLSGTFHNREVFIFNGNNFRVDINRDDVGSRYDFYRNNKNITKELNNGTYTFKANGNSYQIKLQGPKGDILPYSLVSL